MNGLNGETMYESDDEIEEQDQDEEEFEEVSESEGDPDELDYDIDIEGDESEYIDECSVNITHFDLIKKLGTGAYGTVFLVRKNRGVDIDKIYALKVITKAEVVKIPKTIVHMKAERKALEILRDCPYIQTLYYAFQTSDKLFLVTEYLPGGEMFTQVQKGKLPESYVRFYIAELIVALEHIHMQGIVYRDIKLENVLLDAEGHVKLVDFGLCKKLGARGRSKSFCGTEEYMAPEVIACTGHNTAADWWALGVLAIELLSTITPFGTNEGNNSIMNRITNEEPHIPEDISSEMEDFLRKILHKDPGKRLGGSVAAATALKQHRLFDDLDWERLERKQLASPADPPTITHPFDTQNFSAEFTQQPTTYPPTEEPPNSFIMFKGYSYIAPELQASQPNHLADNSIDENWNSLARNILSNYDPNSEFHIKYKFASHQPLGTGKSSVCMKCFNSVDDNYYAVKIYKRGDQNNYEIDFLQKSSEVNVPGVVRLIEVLTDSKWTYVVMELIDGVNLLEYLRAKPAKYLYTAVNFLCKIVGKVHEHEYTHGCICFKNIYYLQQRQELRLIGFGNAKPIAEAHDKQIDYWALGVCIYTILCGHSPFNLSTIAAKQIENNKFDEDSVQWAALHGDVKSYIRQLLRNSTSFHSPGALKKIKNIDVLDASKERLDENERIVKIRALRMETKHAVKSEVISEINGIQDSLMNLEAIDVDQNQLPNTQSQHNHSELNGHAPNGDSKRSLSPTNEPNRTKKAKPDKIKQEPRELRQRKPKLPSSETKRKPKTAVIKTEAVTLPLQNVIPTNPKINAPLPRTRGRPRKAPEPEVQSTITQVATSLPNHSVFSGRQPTTHPKTAVRNSSAHESSAIRSLGVEARDNWVFGWRPPRLTKPIYCFLRFDYK
ncbi:ribosomal protein S6 kinase alpha-5-like [Bradysia coprophila]|uniref:ribosomal protein S6 kinase alpha-5-like n=1 Tax=Bradysia coprophila TaxID=38358 RepID=UPI00187DAF53|nr:ribosomal protein S6 kinase alpha-5-like [Bradysia coprophila]